MEFNCLPNDLFRISSHLSHFEKLSIQKKNEAKKSGFIKKKLTATVVFFGSKVVDEGGASVVVLSADIGGVTTVK